MILVSEAAVAAVKEAMSKAGQQAGGLRIIVQKGGCAGYKYIVDLDCVRRGDDVVVETGGIVVYIDPASLPRLEGMVLGYTRGLEGEGFTFENPKATSTCGCKKSFQ